MKKGLMLCMACLLLLVGCVPVSLNLQKAGLRSTGDLGVTASLDAVDVSAVDDVKGIVADTAESILKFLDDGQVADLTNSAARKEIEKLIPVQYRPYFDAVMSILSTKDVDVEKFGEDNVKRVKAACYGVLSGCEHYDNADRLEEPANTSEPEPVACLSCRDAEIETVTWRNLRWPNLTLALTASDPTGFDESSLEVPSLCLDL